MTPVYLVVGVPCSGKSWVCEQLTDRFEYVRHDDFIGQSYPVAIAKVLKTSTKPVLIETPFSISQVMAPLETAGVSVTPVFIIEDESELDRRYRQREGKSIIPGHLTRQNTYKDRATQSDAFVGTSTEVLKHLRMVGR